MGLQGLIADMLQRCQYDPGQQAPTSLDVLREHDTAALASLISALENDSVGKELRAQIISTAAERNTPVLGITGTGGSGKSSLTDEIIRRFRLDHGDQLRIAIIAVDPTRRKTGGRVTWRSNSHERNRSHPIYSCVRLRPATRSVKFPMSWPISLPPASFASLISSSSKLRGSARAMAAIVPLVDTSLYVMTPEFGAQSQLGENRHARLCRCHRD